MSDTPLSNTVVLDDYMRKAPDGAVVHYHPWVCAQCRKPISNVQAKLSVQRAEGASTACQDCMTRRADLRSHELSG